MQKNFDPRRTRTLHPIFPHIKWAGYAIRRFKIRLILFEIWGIQKTQFFVVRDEADGKHKSANGMKFILDSVENQQYDIKKWKKMQTFVLKHKNIKNIVRTHTNFKLIKISHHSVVVLLQTIGNWVEGSSPP